MHTGNPLSGEIKHGRPLATVSIAYTQSTSSTSSRPGLCIRQDEPPVHSAGGNNNSNQDHARIDAAPTTADMESEQEGS